MAFDPRSQKTGVSGPDWFAIAMMIVGGIAGLIIVAAVIRALLVPPVMATIAESYTTTRVAWTPESPLTEPQREALEQRVDTFVETVRDDVIDEVTSITLTADDLNALLEEEWRDGEGDWKLSLTIINGVIEGLLSIRIENDMAKGVWAPFRGRYVNANCILDLELRGDSLQLELAECTVQGRSVPGFVVRRLNDALAGAIDEDTRRFFANLTALEIVDDRIELIAAPPLLPTS